MPSGKNRRCLVCSANGEHTYLKGKDSDKEYLKNMYPQSRLDFQYSELGQRAAACARRVRVPLWAISVEGFLLRSRSTHMSRSHTSRFQKCLLCNVRSFQRRSSSAALGVRGLPPPLGPCCQSPSCAAVLCESLGGITNPCRHFEKCVVTCTRAFVGVS